MLKSLIPLAAVLHAPATAQLLGEQVSGHVRLCRYPPAAGNFLSDGSVQRVHRTGVGERCPATFPATRSDLSVPPTARLREDPAASRRTSCVYEQGASEWVLPMPESGACPLHAGLLPETRGRRR